MTWPALAAEHFGHWLRFDGPDALRCHTCENRRILLPLRPDLAPTATPPRWRRPDDYRANPELVALRKREALAAIEYARQKRTTKEET